MVESTFFYVCSKPIILVCAHFNYTEENILTNYNLKSKKVILN